MFFTFVGGAPHVVVTIMHRTSAEYGVWFVVISLTYMAGNFAAGRWSAKYGVDFMIRAGVAVTVLGAAVGFTWVLLEPWRGPEVIMTPQMIIGFASGFMLPSAIAGAVSVRPQAAGAASGLMGFMQMGLGALTAQLIGHLLDGAQQRAAACRDRAGAVRLRAGGVLRAGAEVARRLSCPAKAGHDSNLQRM